MQIELELRRKAEKKEMNASLPQAERKKDSNQIE